ncbi:LPXTG-motif protein cell wall anchor domain protein [Actinomyces johnsonii F0542]|uniref:LPXTG-motif protein cell wall anchor domain protein n=1 Tax=Actinomyces johnsonii F0542 TaxID=1321818 RepID=U1QV30_9ACTO|nr:DUF5979 domain-containing protein [Actinomyces johnsonii]ERH25771.1 LPXTG-motif protein cell wall anchor domain protein [Actinomyces johnsonii F0542]
MQVPADLRRIAPRGQSPATWLALLTLLLSTIVPLQAQATVNTDVALSDLALIKSDRDGNDAPGEALTTQDVAKLSYTWDATKTTVTPGDSFSIDLGAHFKNLENPKTVPLNIPFNGTSTEVGACRLTERTMECTFNEKVEELKAAGFKEFKGSGQALLLITQPTTATSVDMTVNGNQKVSVRLPGSGGIKGPAARGYTALKFSKVSSVITSASSAMTWEVNFGSDYIKEQLAKGGTPITSDGQTRETITITDTLGPGMIFNNDKSRWYLGLRNSAAEPSISGVSLTNAAGKDQSAKYGDFDLDVDIQGQVATIKVTGPFAPESNYRISYPVTFTSQNGKAIAGVRYTNAASLDHSDARGEFTRSYTDSFKVTVDMAPGFGGFEVSKTLDGAALDAVDVANTTLPVKVDYVLPGPASGYTGWQAPGTLNADGLSGTAVLNISIGKTNTFQGTFPKGTVVTLSEDTGQASPAPSGYAWGKPVFAVGRTETNTLTIGDRVSTKVTLNNTADIAKAPGTFQVTKTVVGPEAAADARDKDFAFTYTCSDGQSGQVSAKGDGAATQAGATFPQGTTCTVKEDAESARLDGYTLTAPAEQTVTVKDPAEPIATAAFTNSYTRDTGAFSIAKSVQGGPQGAANGSYSFTYTCDGGVQGTLTVPGDGTAVSSPQIPTGVSCALAEDTAAAAKSGYSVTSSLSQDTVTITKDQTVAVTAANTYTRDTGTFSVTKSAKGDYAPQAGEAVKVGYTCNDPEATQGTLDVPMDGTAVSGPALPTGTMCTLSEDATSAQREGYAVSTAYSATTATIVKDQVAEVSVTNTYTRQTGGFSVSKTVEGDGAQLAPAEFTFEYTCTDKVTGKAGSPRQVMVKAGETAHVGDVPTGSCTLTEKDASAKGTSLSTTLAVGGEPVRDGKATFDVLGGDATAVSVSAVNTYTLDRGTFTVSKKVEGDSAETHKNAAFTFEYSCSSDIEGEVSGELTARGDGATASGPALPVGATCSVSEKTSSAQVNGYDVKTPEAQSATITEKDAALSFTNTYTRQTGSFSVLKTVTGAQAGDKQFAFSYTCTDGTEGTLKAKADGEAVAGPRVPTGTQCTVTENSQSAAIDGYTLAAPQAQTVTVSEKDQVASTSFVNAYTEVVNTPSPSASPETSASGEPTPSDPAQEDSGSSLARTGAYVGIPLALALAAIAGGVLLAYRRRA